MRFVKKKAIKEYFKYEKSKIQKEKIRELNKIKNEIDRNLESII